MVLQDCRASRRWVTDACCSAHWFTGIQSAQNASSHRYCNPTICDAVRPVQYPGARNLSIQKRGRMFLLRVLGHIADGSQDAFKFNFVALLQFVFFTFLTCPPNFLWQEYMEEKLPGYPLQVDGTRSLNIANTARKFVLDQTLGAAINTAIFIAGFAAMKGKDTQAIQREVRRETFPLMKNGWKLWPAVSILNFTVVPVHRRILVGSAVGLFWGIYLSIIVAR